MTSIPPELLHEKLLAGTRLCLIDLRTPVEFAAAHIVGARLKPLECFKPQELARELSQEPKPIYLICQAGTRAKQAGEKLKSAGFLECVLVEGGMGRWKEAGLPFERQPCRVISLERQVRIAAGALVLAGTLLGAFVHPGFLVLCGFIGAGLIFAGVSDKCGMAIILARMPWNQLKEVPRASCAATH
jgi:rhodanese-related sulfurtransferase